MVGLVCHVGVVVAAAQVGQLQVRHVEIAPCTCNQRNIYIEMCRAFVHGDVGRRH